MDLALEERKRFRYPIRLQLLGGGFPGLHCQRFHRYPGYGHLHPHQHSYTYAHCYAHPNALTVGMHRRGETAGQGTIVPWARGGRLPLEDKECGGVAASLFGTQRADNFGGTWGDRVWRQDAAVSNAVVPVA